MTTAAQLQHLWAASHALAVTSPAVSAHLMARLFKLSDEKGINLAESTSRQACTACGTVSIPGVNSHVHTSRNRRRKRKTPKRTEEETKTFAGKGKDGGDKGARDATARLQKTHKLRMIFECQVCGRNRSQDVPPPRSKSSSRARSRLATNLAEASAQSPPSTVANASPTPSLRNSSSRKRAKSRKGNSLSDILAAKRRHDSSSGARGNGVGGFGLDLMDLMKAE